MAKTLASVDYHVGHQYHKPDFDFRPTQSAPLRPSRPMHRLGEPEHDPNTFYSVLSRKQNYRINSKFVILII